MKQIDSSAYVGALTGRPTSRAGSDAIDFNNAALPLELRIQAFAASKRPQVQAVSSAPDRRVSCPYCNDRQHLLISIEWLMAGEIPRQIDFTMFADPPHPGSGPAGRIANDSGRTMICCDCHKGFYGTDDRPVPVKRFSDYFGTHIKQSRFGALLLQYRQQRAKTRRQSV